MAQNRKNRFLEKVPGKAPRSLPGPPPDPFQLSPVVTSQYLKNFFLEKVSGKCPESYPESLPIWFKMKFCCSTLYFSVKVFNSYE